MVNLLPTLLLGLLALAHAAPPNRQAAQDVPSTLAPTQQPPHAGDPNQQQQQQDYESKPVRYITLALIKLSISALSIRLQQIFGTSDQDFGRRWEVPWTHQDNEWRWHQGLLSECWIVDVMFRKERLPTTWTIWIRRSSMNWRKQSWPSWNVYVSKSTRTSKNTEMRAKSPFRVINWSFSTPPTSFTIYLYWLANRLAHKFPAFFFLLGISNFDVIGKIRLWSSFGI